MTLKGFSQDEQAGLIEFKRKIRQEFGNRAILLKVFGSKVRGETWEESDIDILVLVQNLTEDEKKKIIELGTLINIDREILLSPLSMTPEEFHHLLSRERRIATDIEREGIEI